MSLELPPKFANDIVGRDTALIPIVKIGDIYISTNSMTYDSQPIFPLLTSNPSLKESVDIEKRNYKISNISITLSNYPYEGKRFSERVEGSLINEPVEVYWISPSTATFGEAFKIYQGQVRRYDHDDSNCKITAEDRSQATLHKDLPLSENYIKENAPEKYIGSAKSMVYGTVLSPCVIENAPPETETGIGGGNIKIIADSSPESDVNIYQQNSTMPPTCELYIYEDNHYIQIPAKMQSPNYNQAEFFEYPRESIQHDNGANNIITIISENEEDDDDNNTIANNLIAGFKTAKTHRMIFSPLQKQSTHFSEEGSQVLATNTWYTSIGRNLDNNNRYIAGSILLDFHSGWNGDSFLTYLEETVQDAQYDGAFNDLGGLGAGSEASIVGFVANIDGISTSNVKESQGILKFEIELYIAGLVTWNERTIAPITFRYGRNIEDNVLQQEVLDTLITDHTLHEWELIQTINKAVQVNDMEKIFMYARPQLGAGSWGGAVKLKINSMEMEQWGLFEGVLNKDYYATVIGRTQGDKKANTIITDILNRELGQEIGESELSGNYDGWQYDFAVNKKISSKSLIEGISSVSPYLPRFNNMGEFIFTEIPMEGEPYNADQLHTINNIDVIDFSFSRTSINDRLYTKIVLKYDWDYAKGDFRKSVDADTGVLLEYEPEYYGLNANHSESTLVIDDNGRYIRQTITAQAFADWYLLWSCNQKLKLKIKLSLKWLNLEIGDFVNFDKLLGDIKPYGIDYVEGDGIYEGVFGNLNGQEYYKNFMIVATVKNLEFIEIECIQMHNLDIGELPIFGCLTENDDNYDQNATYHDPDACADPVTFNVTYISINEDILSTGAVDTINVYPANFDNNIYTITELAIHTQEYNAITHAKIIVNGTTYNATITNQEEENVQYMTFAHQNNIELFNKVEDMVNNSFSYNFTFELSIDGGDTFNQYIKAVQYNLYDCAPTGDLNNDGGWNVLDTVTLANCVLAGNCAELDYGCAADLNGDGGYNVLDIVTLANCILAGNCGG